MSLTEELRSWTYGMKVDVKELPQPGSSAPTDAKLQFPRPSGKPAVVTFLRHCGCPFAERDFLALRALASQPSNSGIDFLAVSHSSQPHTDKWLAEVGGRGAVTVIVDDSRQLHADWGLGPSGWTHILSPAGFSALYSLGRERGIWNRPTESGSRWQTAGTFAVASDGRVAWALRPERMETVPDWEAAVAAVRV